MKRTTGRRPLADNHRSPPSKPDPKSAREWLENEGPPYLGFQRRAPRRDVSTGSTGSKDPDDHGSAAPRWLLRRERVDLASPTRRPRQPGDVLGLFPAQPDPAGPGTIMLDRPGVPWIRGDRGADDETRSMAAFPADALVSEPMFNHPSSPSDRVPDPTSRAWRLATVRAPCRRRSHHERIQVRSRGSYTAFNFFPETTIKLIKGCDRIFWWFHELPQGGRRPENATDRLRLTLSPPCGGGPGWGVENLALPEFVGTPRSNDQTIKRLVGWAPPTILSHCLERVRGGRSPPYRN
jgi:hypothetical protein